MKALYIIIIIILIIIIIIIIIIRRTRRRRRIIIIIIIMSGDTATWGRGRGDGTTARVNGSGIAVGLDETAPSSISVTQLQIPL